MKKINLVLSLAIGLVIFLISQWPDNNLRLTFCNVGQGDAIIVSYKTYQVLIDGGPDNSVLYCLGKNLAFWDRKLEVVVLTHPQADHMTGLIEVLRRYRVEKFLASNIVNDTPEYWQLKELVASKGIKTKELTSGDKLRFGPVELEAIWPETQVLGVASFIKDTNKIATVLKGRFNNFKWLLTSDSGEKEESLMSDKLEPVEILKVGHHGSKYSSGEIFLKTVKPQVAVISVGKNQFGHPTPEVLKRLEAVGAEVLRTDEKGTVQIESDGKSWWLNGVK